MARSGRRSVTCPGGCLTVPDLGHDGVALFFQHLLEVQADQRLILGDNDSQLLLAHADERTGTG